MTHAQREIRPEAILVRTAAVLLAVLIMASSAVHAQSPCQPAWLPALGSGDLIEGSFFVTPAVLDFTVHNDGSGPALYVAGDFLRAGGVVVNGIARWDGTSWSGLSVGMNNVVHALAVFDDGQGDGPALYAGGSFSFAGGIPASRIARWNGSSWSSLGSGVFGGIAENVRALAVFDDGSGGGEALYVGGSFLFAGGVPSSNIARWSGSQWSALGSGVDGPGFPRVDAIAAYDDGLGSGPALYAGGNFTSAGGVIATYIARWDGDAWSPLGEGLGGLPNFPQAWVFALAVHDDGLGEGPALYAGGNFTMAGGEITHRIARWNGHKWSPLGEGVFGAVRALGVYDDGTGGGPALYAGGEFSNPAARIARWDGERWSGLGAGLGGSFTSVRGMAVWDDGAGRGPLLYAGGTFTVSPAGTEYLAAWGGCAGPLCPGDFVGDGFVGHLDLLKLVGEWGPCPLCVTDLNGDGVVDWFDLIILLENWGPCP